MHTTAAFGITFHHHGDYSGRILFTAPDAPGATVACPFSVLASAEMEHRGSPTESLVELTVSLEHAPQQFSGSSEVAVRVPIGAVRALVADRVRGDRIRELEDAEDEDLCRLGAHQEIPRWAAGSD